MHSLGDGKEVNFLKVKFNYVYMAILNPNLIDWAILEAGKTGGGGGP